MYSEESHLIALRDVFESVAETEQLADWRACEVPAGELARMAHIVRDARLELIRLSWKELTEKQREIMHDMEVRLDGAARGSLSPEPLPRKAREALVTFGWKRP